MPWTKLNKPKGKFKYKSPSGKLWTLGMIQAYLAKKHDAKGMRTGKYGR